MPQETPKAPPVRLSVIVPTCGRTTLENTLRSAFACGMRPQDEIIVVGDGPQPKAKEIVERFGSKQIKFIETEAGDWRGGGHQRNTGMDRASGSHLIFMDDDDEYINQALERIRNDIQKHPGRLLLYRIIDRDGSVYWKHKDLRAQNIGTPCMVVPNDPNLLGRWPNSRGADHYFITHTVPKWPKKEESIVWLENFVCRIRPHLWGDKSYPS